MVQLRHLSSTDIYAAKYSRVSVSIPEAGCGDHTLKHNGFTLKSDVIERSPLLQSLLCTKGETCVPISSDHFHIWATYEPASTVEASSLIPILEVCIACDIFVLVAVPAVFACGSSWLCAPATHSALTIYVFLKFGTIRCLAVYRFVFTWLLRLVVPVRDT